MYKFRFSRLMEVKEKLLEHKQRELETALAAVADLVSRARAIEGQIAEQYNDMVARCITGKEFSLLVGYLTYLDGKKATIEGLKDKADARVNLLRAKLSGLAIEVKMLEKLRSKDLREARKADSRREQKMMDDLALRIEGK
ncbi:MAG: flagellar export protein FliJ [Syntrophorhabdales bacterium]